MSVLAKEARISLCLVKEERMHYIIHILDVLLHITFNLKDFSQARRNKSYTVYTGSVLFIALLFPVL